MSEQFTNRQRTLMWEARGRPTLSLEFDVFGTDSVSMWAHTRHEIPFADMRRAFEAIRDHIESFLVDGYMCPFNPEFTQHKTESRFALETEGS